jgi:hypothetical protein
MIISFRHSLNHYKFYKIALIIALMNFKFTDLFIFYLPFISKFVLIFWEFNQFFSCKIFLFFYYFFKRAEQIFHYFVVVKYFCENFDVFRVCHSWLISYKSNIEFIYGGLFFYWVGHIGAHFLPLKFLIFYWSLNQLWYHWIQ